MMAQQGHPLHVLAGVVGATLHGGDGAARITHLAIDSRKPMPVEGTLFICLRGERHDGHRYIPELIARGVRHFLVQNDSPLPAPEIPWSGPSAEFVTVADTRDALQRLAAWHRAHFQFPVVGITGSNGKTVVKEWLFQLLRGSEHIVRSPGSWNSQVGVPLSVWEMHEGHTLGLIEAGISEPGEMERLRAVVKPSIGLFTNIGPAHGENFHSDLDKALEKVKLFRDAGTLVYCADHGTVHEAVTKAGLGQRATLRTWSRERNGWLHVPHERRTANGTAIHVINDEADFTFEIPFTDPASVENAMHCVTLLLHLGHRPAWIAERTPLLAPVAMRMEVLDGMHGITLINDTYSNDAASLAIALEHLEAIAAGRPKAVVLSDILESGDAAEVLYARVAALLQRAGVEKLLTVGPRIAAEKHRFTCSVEDHPDTDHLLTSTDPATLAGYAVLVKGARAFALERVTQRWQRQVHGTVLEIDLEAVRHNLNHYRALLGPQVRIMAMVKAFGYGGGAVELARLLAHERVHYLGVAYADEGIDLRQHGIGTPILVMNPEPVPFEVMRRFQLEAEVYDLHGLREADQHAGSDPAMPPIHLKLDTGMRRLGFAPEDLPALLEALRDARHLRVASILSHFSAADDPAQDDHTRQQLSTFLRMADAIAETLGYRPLRHIAHSAGTTRFPAARLDMVRLGIGLHGIGFDVNEQDLLRPVATLRTPVAQIKHLRAGDTVGYGRSWRAEGARVIATLPIGYADGISRRLSNGVGRVWIHGKAAPIVGRVCMDMCMVDVTGIPCDVGDEAIVFGPEHPVGELAAALGTIPYEVLTSIPPRVKRVYLRG
ncbi:MAG: bifunctional UDP-N-acetylmuramoyl-tripeptide:D-alanyl-D-alanine ligase/alanine racemase [Flavobacteriales bacterium]|nr:bifunctional UDP-N-acetylmuramoyl-tripeptide:D-alanyl-D-alanine ligase/alanine racemase [Flavobacteriales bacterium]